MADAFVEKAPGSNDGGWPTTPANAYVNDNNYAITTTTDDACVYYNFDFSSIATGSTVTGIRVRINGDWNDPGSTDITSPRYALALSWNGGSNWTTEKTTQFLQETAEEEFYLGDADDDWGRTWTLAEVQDTNNFRVRITSKSTGVTGAPEWRVDFLQLAVYYWDAGAVGGGGVGSSDDAIGFVDSVTSSIIAVAVTERLGFAESSSSGSVSSGPTGVKKAGTAITSLHSSSVADFDAAARYNRIEGAAVYIRDPAFDLELVIGHGELTSSPEDPNFIVQRCQSGLISINSITYSSDFGSAPEPGKASIVLANKLYGNALAATSSSIPDLVSRGAFVGAEIIVYALAKGSITPWRSRVIFRGAIQDVDCSETQISVSANQLGDGGLPVPDLKITDNTFYYEENTYGGQPGREGKKVDGRLGSVIPIGIGRFDITAVKDTWTAGHILELNESDPAWIWVNERCARGIIPAMLGIKFPMMPAVAAVRNWTGRHSAISTVGISKKGRSSDIYQLVFLHGTRRGRKELYVSHGTPNDQWSYTFGSTFQAQAQQAHQLPIYTWDSSLDRALPFVRDVSERSVGPADNSPLYLRLFHFTGAGSMDVPTSEWTDGDGRYSFGTFVNIAPTTDSLGFNMLTRLPYHAGALQMIAMPFDRATRLGKYARGDSYIFGILEDDIFNARNIYDKHDLDGIGLVYDDSESKKGQGVWELPNRINGTGQLWGTRIGGIWNPEAGSYGQLEMYGRVAGPYDNAAGSEAWNMLRVFGDAAKGQYNHESINTAMVVTAGDLQPGNYIKMPKESGYLFRYFAWWIRAPWLRTYSFDGPNTMVAGNPDPHFGQHGMTEEWEFMSWGWDAVENTLLFKYPWEVRLACGQTQPSVDNSIVVNKAWLEAIFKSDISQKVARPEERKDLPIIYAERRSGGLIISPAARRSPSAFQYLWDKGIYPSLTSETSFSDIFLTGQGVRNASGQVIEKAPDVAKVLIEHYGGDPTVAASTDFGSFDTATTLASDLPLTLIVNRQETLASVIGQVGMQSSALIEQQIDDNGELIWRAFIDTDDPATDAPARLYRTDLEFVKQDIFEDTFRAYTTEMNGLTSDIRVRYGYHLPSGEWSNEVFLNRNGTNLDTDASSYILAAQSTYSWYGELENPQIHEFPDVWKKASADRLLKWLFNKQRRPLVMVDFTTYVRHTDLRIGHVIKFNDELKDHCVFPGQDWTGAEISAGYTMWSEHLFTVLGISYSKDLDGFLHVHVLAQEVWTQPWQVVGP